MTTQRTALLGGSFNPPHLSHLLGAAVALNQSDCAECWLVPVAGHPFGKDSAPFGERVAMCERMIAPFEGRLGICPIEQELEQPSYTVQTLSALSKRHPGRRWAWIIGSDNVGHLGKWKDVERLFDLAEVWVLGRGGTQDGKSPYADRLRWITTDDLPIISSTEIRERVRKGESIAGLVVQSVADYVAARELYR